MSDEQVTRRCFVRGTAVLGAGVVVASVAGGKDEEPKTITLSFADHGDLTRPGGSVEAKLPNGMPILVACVDDGKYVCVQLKCTHERADLAYDPKKKLFCCPAHNAEFDLDGNPVSGPAKRPLDRYDSTGAVIINTKRQE